MHTPEDPREVPDDGRELEPVGEVRDPRALHSIRDGYELTDISVNGVVAFLGVLAATVVIFFLFAFGFGRVIDMVMRRTDGTGRVGVQAGTSATGDVKGKHVASNEAIEQGQLQQLTAQFPTPRLQDDDGDQDLADMHAREDLLLEHYSYVDQGAGKVRIPIERAMELIAERGLPVAPAAANAAAGPSAAAEKPMFGDSVPVVRAPLTDGFARTGFEQAKAAPAMEPGDQTSAKANNN